MKRAGRALMACVACLVSACSTTDVVLATLPDDTEAGPSIRCATAFDCPIGLYCDESSCDATSGTCQVPPAATDCPDTEMPFCGCDGITYFNDCLRKARGISSSTQGPCFAGESCGPSFPPCPAGSTCGLLAGDCPPPGTEVGSCWVVPDQCPTAHGQDMWDSCQPDQQHCASTCTAVQSGTPFKRAPECH